MSSLKSYIESLRGRLPINDERILGDPSVEREMRGQWYHPAPPTLDDLVEKQVMWAGIVQRTLQQPRPRFVLLRQLARIAAVLVLVFLAGWFAHRQASDVAPAIVYATSTGKQDSRLLTLADGTQVKLGAGSKLTYPADFGSTDRVVHLEGQGFFDVAKDASRPFSVQSEGVRIQAIGTAFEVFHNRAQQTVETVLLNGKVAIEKRNIQNGRIATYTLMPDQKLVVSLASDSVVMVEENANRYLQWRSYDGLSFSNEQLSNILPRLEYWYGCNIHVRRESLLNERFSFKVRNEPLGQLLQLIGHTTPIHYTFDEALNTWTIN